MDKKIIVIILVVVLVVGGFSWLKYRDTERTRRTNENLLDFYSLESGKPNATKKNILTITERGDKETVVEDISILPGFPQDDDSKYGLKIIAGSNNRLLFKGIPYIEGNFYSPVYILSTTDFNRGFEKVEGFLVGGVSEEGYVNQDGSKIVGIMSHQESESYTSEIIGIIVGNILPEENEKQDDSEKSDMYYQYDELFVLDLRDTVVTPEKFYEPYAGQTFFFPSFYGDDDMHIQWKSNNELEIKEYLTDEIYRNIEANTPENFPDPIRTRIIVF